MHEMNIAILSLAIKMTGGHNLTVSVSQWCSAQMKTHINKSRAFTSSSVVLLFFFQLDSSHLGNNYFFLFLLLQNTPEEIVLGLKCAFKRMTDRFLPLRIKLQAKSRCKCRKFWNGQHPPIKNSGVDVQIKTRRKILFRIICQKESTFTL